MKSINHLHIPRCSGIYIKTHIVNDLKSRDISYFATNHSEIYPETFNNKKFISGHFGLTPLKYRNDLINISLLRDPVDRFVSNFIYVHPGYKGAQLYSKLDEWIENENQHNLQAKSLSQNINEDLYNSLNHGLERAKAGWCLENKNINLNEIKKLIDGMEIVNTIDNHYKFINDLNELIYKCYGFYTFTNRNLINENYNKIAISKNLRKNIEQVNTLDMEIYEYVKSKS